MYEQDEAVLGDSLIKKRLIRFIPNTFREENLVLSKETKYVGLLAEFYHYENSQAMMVFPVVKHNVLKTALVFASRVTRCSKSKRIQTVNEKQLFVVVMAPHIVSESSYSAWQNCRELNRENYVIWQQSYLEWGDVSQPPSFSAARALFWAIHQRKMRGHCSYNWGWANLSTTRNYSNWASYLSYVQRECSRMVRRLVSLIWTSLHRCWYSWRPQHTEVFYCTCKASRCAWCRARPRFSELCSPC